MSKLNKRGGFTLAELLIVVAIIAILIAIAIPAFGGQLNNAKLAADHANIRNAYAIAQVANLEGGITKEDGSLDTTSPVYFNKDGSVSSSGDAYQLKVNAKDDGTQCGETKYACRPEGTNLHKVGNKIRISQTTTKEWKLDLVPDTP